MSLVTFYNDNHLFSPMESAMSKIALPVHKQSKDPLSVVLYFPSELLQRLIIKTISVDQNC